MITALLVATLAAPVAPLPRTADGPGIAIRYDSPWGSEPSRSGRQPVDKDRPRPNGKLLVFDASGPRAGRHRGSDGPKYLIEVEEGAAVARAEAAHVIEEILGSPRGWRRAHGPLVRVARPPVDFRVTLASPRTTDRLCAPLQTHGRLSCFNEGRAVLNVKRWNRGAKSYGSRLGRYRTYLVNHEVGHALGYGHTGCPGPGRRAPVMMQQTLGLGACEPGPWPFRARSPERGRPDRERGRVTGRLVLVDPRGRRR